MRALTTAFGVYINDLPYFLLCVSIMWDYMRISKRRAWAIMIGMATLHAISIFCWMSFYESWDSIRMPHEVIFLGVFLSGLLYGVRLRPTRLLFAGLMVKFYADVISSAAKVLQLNFWHDETFTSFSLQFNLMHLMLLFITLPPMWLFIKRTLRPIFLVENDMWRWLWMLPGLFYFTHFIFSYYDAQNIYSFRYVLFSAPLFCLSLLTYMIIGGNLRTAQEKAQLQIDVEAMNHQLELQRVQYEGLAGHIEQNKAAQHDYRHHLTVLANLSKSENLKELQTYIDEMQGDLLPPIKIWCENYTVNALVSHYLLLAEREEIHIDVKMDIPQETGQILGADLCIIIGNLLENAMEACRYIKESERFIKVRARTEGDYISLMIENSFDGVLKEQGGVYYSRKQEELQRKGVGISSVQAISEKYNGILRIETQDNIWRASVLLTARIIYSDK